MIQSVISIMRHVSKPRAYRKTDDQRRQLLDVSFQFLSNGVHLCDSHENALSAEGLDVGSHLRYIPEEHKISVNMDRASHIKLRTLRSAPVVPALLKSMHRNVEGF